MSDEKVHLLINVLENKKILSDLEKDILDSYNDLMNPEIDEKSLKFRIKQNRIKYAKDNIIETEIKIASIQKMVNPQKEIVFQNLNQLKKEDLKGNLNSQIIFLCNQYFNDQI